MKIKLGMIIVMVATMQTGCATDLALKNAEDLHAKLRLRVYKSEEKLRKLTEKRDRLKSILVAGRTYRTADRLIEDLRDCDILVSRGEGGTLRLRLKWDAFNSEGELVPMYASRLARAAVLLRTRMPDHELTIESAEMTNAVRALKFVNKHAGVPGSRLRAISGSTASGLSLEVRPTRLETLKEVLSASLD